MKLPFLSYACLSLVTYALVNYCGGLCFADAPTAPVVVYQWNSANFHPAPGNPWKSETVTAPDGSQRLSISGTGQGYNNYIAVAKGKLQADHEYTALVKYEIVAPTVFPSSFYMFGRSSKLGQAQDYWQMWNGDAGSKGIARLTMSLRGNRASDDWVFYVGCKGPGTMIIDSFQIIEGTGLDYTPATAIKAAALPLPKTTILPTGAKPFVLDPPAAKKGLTLKATDFGLVSDSPAGPASTEVATANLAAIGKAIKACREQGASVLEFPPGVYRFYGNEAIPFVDLSDLTVDGHGCEFIFEKLKNVEAVSVQRCQRTVFKNLKIDWDWSVTPIASLGRIVSVAPDNLSCEMTFPDLDERQIEQVKKAPWTQLIPFEPLTLTRRSSERNSVSVANLENADAKTLRVTFKTPVPLKAGETYCVRHLYYGFDAFKVGFSNNLVFDNVTIYSIPGMGWFNTGDMFNWKLVNCRIARREGSRNPLTTAADGFHVSQSQGNLTLENCEFTGSGDDSINIHDNCYQGVQRIDDTTLALVNCPPWRLRLSAGDRIELFRSDYAPLGFTSTVKAVATKEKNLVLTLADPLPVNLSPLSIVQNKRYDTHNVRITGCNFHDTNGRSILLSARDSTIENCTFKNAVGTAIQFHTEIVGDLWAEGSGASNVLVRGNTFQNTSFEGRYENAVVYAGAKLPIGVTTYPLFHDILIEKNRFINSSGPAVSLASAKDVVVRDNTIDSPQATAAANYLSGALYTAYTSDITFSGNIWKAIAKTGKAGVLVDPSTTSDIEIRGNVGPQNAVE